MGHSLAWIAARDLPLETTLDRLRLDATCEPADYVESALTACALPGGWSLVVAHGCEHRIIDARQLAALSQDCEVMACSAEEHVMYCCAELWSDGHRVWRVAHDAQQSFDHLSAEGELPADLDAVLRRHAEQQQAEGGAGADVDLHFDIPTVLAQSRVGFKHDEGASPEPQSGFWAVLDRTATQTGRGRVPWWQFWR